MKAKGAEIEFLVRTSFPTVHTRDFQYKLCLYECDSAALAERLRPICDAGNDSASLTTFTIGRLALHSMRGAWGIWSRFIPWETL